MPPLRFTEHAESLVVCRHKLDRLLDQRRTCPFDEGQQRRYNRLCAVETMFLQAHTRIATRVAESHGG